MCSKSSAGIASVRALREVSLEGRLTVSAITASPRKDFVTDFTEGREDSGFNASLQSRRCVEAAVFRTCALGQWQESRPVPAIASVLPSRGCRSVGLSARIRLAAGVEGSANRKSRRDFDAIRGAGVHRIGVRGVGVRSSGTSGRGSIRGGRCVKACATRHR